MNTQMNLVEEEHTLSETLWIDISIEPENLELFEAFCEQNRIPFEVIDSTAEEVICSVRDGMDVKDVASYMLRMTVTPRDAETYRLIHMLFQLRICWGPEYEYEFHLYRTPEDEWLLSHFEYSLEMDVSDYCDSVSKASEVIHD